MRLVYCCFLLTYCYIFVMWLFVYHDHVDSAGSTSSYLSANANQEPSWTRLTPPPTTTTTTTIPPPVVPLCFSNEFQCRDGGCVKSEYRCDNITDCRDQSDEWNCSKYKSPTDASSSRSSRTNCLHIIPRILYMALYSPRRPNFFWCF